MAEIASDPAQRRVMHIVLVQQRLRSAKILRAPTPYRERSGNVRGVNR